MLRCRYDPMVDDKHDERPENEAIGGEDAGRDGERTVELLDRHVIQDIRIPRKDDNQTCHTRESLRRIRIIYAVRDEQSCAQHMVEMNTEN